MSIFFFFFEKLFNDTFGCISNILTHFRYLACFSLHVYLNTLRRNYMNERTKKFCFKYVYNTNLLKQERMWKKKFLQAGLNRLIRPAAELERGVTGQKGQQR